MAKIYGGKQAAMRHTEIKRVRVYLGPFPSVLKMRDAQKFTSKRKEMVHFGCLRKRKKKAKEISLPAR
jgi:hypothetical protein